MSFEMFWQEIVNHAGEKFYTKKGLEFTYKVIGNAVVPDRTNYPLSKNDFEKAYNIVNLTGPGIINDLVRGPSYIYAILATIREEI